MNKPIGLLLLTQGRQGECLLESAAHILGEWPKKTLSVCLLGTERRGEIEARVKAAVEELSVNTGGVLILCDLYGSTQSNIAARICADKKNAVRVAGLNLAMLLEAISMRHRPLQEAQQRSANAGKDSIVENDGDD